MDRQKRRQILQQLIAAQRGRCIYCSQLTDQLTLTDINLPTTPTIDHVHPRSRGGPDTRENMVMACYECNTHKGSIYQSRQGPTPDQILAQHPAPADQTLIRHWLLRLRRSLDQIYVIHPSARKKAIWARFTIWENELYQCVLRTRPRQPIHEAGMCMRDHALVACWQVNTLPGINQQQVPADQYWASRE